MILGNVEPCLLPVEEVPDLAGVLFDVDQNLGLGVAPPPANRADLFTNAATRPTLKA